MQRDTTHIKEAVQIVGGQRRLATILGVTVGAVSQWCQGRRPVPPGRCRGIEVATGGRVTRYQLDPDTFGEAPENERVA